MALEFFTNVLSQQMEETEVGFFNPYRSPTVVDPKVTPTHYTTEGGGTYSARPDLTRSGGPGIYRAAAVAGVAGATIVGATLITESYDEIIEDATPSEQRSLWHVFASGLTGTFGIGSGLNL
jgi:hypothetical protein